MRLSLDLTDVAALYRNRANEIKADRRKPVLSVVVEFYDDQIPVILVLGNGTDPDPRENLSAVLDAIGALSEGGAVCNAQASN